MALDVQYISLDISKQPTPQQVRLGQGDANATQLVVSVFDDGIAYSLDSYSVRLEMRLPNSDNYYSEDGTRSGNVATFNIDETYAATSYGFDGFGYVAILSGETVICSTSRFQLVVLKNAQEGADPSTAYSNGIIEATERAIAAAEAAEGVVLQDVPTMSALIKGGALLGSGLEVEGQVLSVSPVTTAQVDGIMADTAVTGDESLSATGLAYFWGKLKAWALGAFAALSHTHAASDVTSGTLPVARGGTGVTTAAAERDRLGLGNTTDALPIANGGTGAATAAAALANLGAAAVDSDGFVTVAGEPSYPLFIWDSTHVSPEDYGGTYPISPCFVYYIPNKGLYYCTDN